MAKDCYYFKHDANARRDPKIRSLRKKYGSAGYGNYWIIIEELRETSKYKLEDKPYVWDSLAEQMFMSIEDAKAFVKDLANGFDLLAQEKGFFWSPSLSQRMSQLDLIRQKRSYAGKMSGEARRGDD